MSVYTAKKTEGLKNFFLSYTTVVSFDRLSAKGEKREKGKKNHEKVCAMKV